MMERQRDISPPLPPDPALVAQYASSPPNVKRSRDSVIGDTSSQLSTSSSRKSRTRSRATSDGKPIIPQHEPQPIRDAVDRAFDQSIDHSPTTSQHLDPSFIAQVTEAVVKNLVNANIGVASGSGSQSSSQYPPPPLSSSSQSAACEPIPQSPPQSPVLSDASLPFLRTPPSPSLDKVKLRDSVQSISGDSFSVASHTAESDGKPRPARVDDADSSDDEMSAPDSKLDDSRRSSKYAVSVEDMNSFDAKPTDSRRSSKYATSGDNSGSARTRRASPTAGRPGVVPPSSSASNNNGHGEPTAVEKAWQTLFDRDAKPTPRLGQFLRGIAMHLINDYEPKATFVVTPAKLLRFLEENRVVNESYPWRTMLGGSITCASISTIYRRLLCQHHLVQTTLHEPPNLPGLTPQGFETFMITLIQAHPDHAYERLSQAVVHMPISNADSPKERFPKELSRRLLPAKANAQAEQRLIASMAHEPQIKLKNSTAMPPPPPQPAQSHTSKQQGPLPERQRMPYSRASHSNVFDDDDLTGPSAPIERERKPYVAREGGGKIHRDSESERQSGQYRSDEPPPHRVPRQNSMSGAFPYSGTTPPEQRAARRTRLNTGPGSQPPLSYTDPNVGRNGGRRSPPLTTQYARCDIGSHDSGPASYNHRMSDPSIEFDRRYNPRRATASSTGPPTINDDDPRGKPIPMRQSHAANGFDPGYGMQPPQVPLSTSLPRSRQPPPLSNSFEERRKSTYAAPTNTGVPDGWNTFADHPANYPPPPQRQGTNGLSGNGMNH